MILKTKKSKEVAIIIASKGPSRYLSEILDKLDKVCPAHIKYKVYLVSCGDSELENTEKVVNIRDSGSGSCNAYNLGVKSSYEDYVFIMTAYTIPDDNLFTMVEFLDSLEHKICSFSYDTVPYTPVYSPRCPILRWPAAHRSFIDTTLGGVIFNESFKHHFMDNWLSVWLSLSGKPCIVGNARLISKPHITAFSHDSFDEDVFKQLMDKFSENSCYNNMNIV
jgi:hypothetical protein